MNKLNFQIIEDLNILKVTAGNRITFPRKIMNDIDKQIDSIYQVDDEQIVFQMIENLSILKTTAAIELISLEKS
jgi:hypothetical protein